MGLTINVKIKGLDQLRTAFHKYPTISKPFINKAIKKAIRAIEIEAKPITPIDTGELRKSYKKTFRDFYGALQPGGIGVAKKYAFYVHEGTYKMGARPYLLAGIKSANKDVEKEFRWALNSALDKIARYAKT